MKKTVLIVSLLTFVFSGYAQKLPIALQERVPKILQKKGLESGQIESILQRRLQVSYNKALQARELARKEIQDEIFPCVSVQAHPKLKEAKIYPQYPWLDTSEKVANYLAVRNNRIYLQELKRETKWLESMDRVYPKLHKAAYRIKQPPKGEEIMSIAEKIPSQATHIFIGEEHYTSQIPQKIIDLIAQIRQRNKDRQIFLFTEFLPEKLVWAPQQPLEEVPTYMKGKSYMQVWKSALQQQITIVGLEPPFAAHEEEIPAYMQRGTENCSQIEGHSVWASLEGIRLRNEAWQKVLEKYQQDYPSALFLVYTGSGHLLYHRAFSLTRNWPKENTFVLAITMSANVLEYFYPKANFPQRVIYWDDPELSLAAGYDAHIFVK